MAKLKRGARRKTRSLLKKKMHGAVIKLIRRRKERK